MQQPSEQVVLVSPDDRPVGVAEKIEAHRRGLRHRAFSVILFNSAGEMLIQQRAAGKYHSGGLWANACCSHPRPDERAQEAAARGLDWELGVRCSLEPLQTVSYCERVSPELIENEISHLFIGNYDGPVHPNPGEVSAVRWIDRAGLLRETEADPERFAVWFQTYLQRASALRTVMQLE